MATKVQLTIDLVHRLDALQAERAKMTTAIDVQIKQIETQIAELTGDRGNSVEHRIQRKPAKLAKGGLGDKLYNLLAASPGADYAMLATQMYGADSIKNRNRLRSLIMMLKKQNRVRSSETGRWEVLATQ